MIIKLTGGKVYDPLNQIDGKIRDLYIEDGKIIQAPNSDYKYTEYDIKGSIVMPGAIDIHTHIGGGKVNIGRCTMNDVHGAGCDSGALDTYNTGIRYAEMGYTACFEPAMLACNARQAHLEMADTPCVDTGAYVMVGNTDLLLELLATNADAKIIKDYVAWMMDKTQAMAVKIVNPGGINAFKFNQRRLDIDEQSVAYNITPRRIIECLTKTLSELNTPHPLHVHTSNLGVPGNYRTTLDTIKAAAGYPMHLTHIQFHSYGSEGDHHFSSAAAEIAEAINQNQHLTTDVGQIMFGQTVTVSGDSMMQYANHVHASPDKWTVMDIEAEAGCGVVPFKYRDKNFVNALQWAIGLEIFLLVNDPWRVFLTTDHPNGAPFTSYPHLIRLLMDYSYRVDMLKELHPEARKMSTLDTIKREYTLYEIAIMTRAAPARSLGLSNKGHLAVGADADIVVYTPSTNIEQMFAHPRYVFKNGVLMVKDAKVINIPPCYTHVVKPEYDTSIEKLIKKHYQDYRTVNFENSCISSDEIAECVGSPIVEHPCRTR
ncbi:MAG: formylmethanofuran dehydrogenase subunit A [Chromatiales bacterium]|nr:formylmethanofuran dehydrogenase subunit A [Chromatiales bacterium]